jgi:alpha-beta hydrolase superfamily lysophospholipase
LAYDLLPTHLVRFFSIFGCRGLFWKLGLFALPLVFARSPLEGQELTRSMKSSNELIEAPRFFSSPLHQKWPRKILIVSGLDETEKDYERLISLLEKESYQVGLYIPKSEDKNFDGDFSASQTEFVQFLKNWVQQKKPQEQHQELHLIGHSMAYALLMKSLLENPKLANEVSSLTFTNPMLRLRPLYKHLLSSPLKNPVDLRLTTPLSAEHSIEIQIQRSKNFIEGYEDFSASIFPVLNQSNWSIPTQILMSQGDPNIELEVVETQWKEHAQILRIESTRHNLLRKPESHQVTQSLFAFFQNSSSSQIDSGCQKFLKGFEAGKPIPHKSKRH